jgi:hypothetical protein
MSPILMRGVSPLRLTGGLKKSGSKPLPPPFTSVSAGAYYANDMTFTMPAAFQSLADLLLFYQVTFPQQMNAQTQIYSLNGISTQYAIAVYAGQPPFTPSSAVLLYLHLAASHCPQFWYYLLNYCGISPPAAAGPVVTQSQAWGAGVSYVGISNQAGNATLLGFWEPGLKPVNPLQVTQIAASG